MIIFSRKTLRVWNNRLNLYKILDIWFPIAFQESCLNLHFLQQRTHQIHVLYVGGMEGVGFVIPA